MQKSHGGFHTPPQLKCARVLLKRKKATTQAIVKKISGCKTAAEWSCTQMMNKENCVKREKMKKIFRK